jgi:hypothetical protein
MREIAARKGGFDMLPGFTADRALGRRASVYRGASRLVTSAAASVQPQRISSPYGPIGLPGQNACEVCWHMCMSFGGGGNGYARCAQQCSATCATSLGAFGMLRTA